MHKQTHWNLHPQMWIHKNVGSTQRFLQQSCTTQGEKQANYITTMYAISTACSYGSPKWMNIQLPSTTNEHKHK